MIYERRVSRNVLQTARDIGERINDVADFREHPLKVVDLLVSNPSLKNHATPDQQRQVLHEASGRLKALQLRYKGCTGLGANIGKTLGRAADELNEASRKIDDVPELPSDVQNPLTKPDKFAKVANLAQLQQALDAQFADRDVPIEKSDAENFEVSHTTHQVQGYGVGVSQTQGRRDHMDDTTVAYEQNGLGIVGLFDGHTGSDVSTTLAINMPYFTAKHLQRGVRAEQMRSNLKNMFERKDTLSRGSWMSMLWGRSAPPPTFQSVVAQYSLKGGSTAVLTVFDAQRFFIANAGDSRAVLVRHDGSGQRLTVDHKPFGSERENLERRGGKVVNGYVDHCVNMARSVGDMKAPSLKHRPQVTLGNVRDGGFIVLGSDGFYDVVSDERAAAMVHDMQQQGEPPEKMAESLTQHALDQGSHDNISVVVIALPQAQKI